MSSLSAFEEAFISQGSAIVHEQLDLVEHLQQSNRVVELAGFGGCGVLVLAMYMHFLQQKTSFRLATSKAPKTLEDWRVVQTHSAFTFILYSTGIFLTAFYASLSDHLSAPLRAAMGVVLCALGVLAYSALEYVLPQRKGGEAGGKKTHTLQVPVKDQPMHTPSTVAGTPYQKESAAEFPPQEGGEGKGEKGQQVNKRLLAPARGGGRH